MEVALKLAGSSFNSLQLTFIRFFIGGLFLLPFALCDLKKRKYRLSAGDWLYLLLLGIICICISMTLFQFGVMNTNANLAAIIISMSPVFTMIFAHFITDDKFSVKKAVVLLFNCAGLVIIAYPFISAEGSKLSGIIYTLFAAVAFGLFTALGKKRINIIGGIVLNSFSFILGSLTLLVFILIMGIPVTAGIGLGSVPILLYTGVCVTGIGYYCYIKVVENAGPSTASITFFIKPIIAPVIAYIVLREAISINVILGVCFVIAGSLINMLKSDKPSVKH